MRFRRGAGGWRAGTPQIIGIGPAFKPAAGGGGGTGTLLTSGKDEDGGASSVTASMNPDTNTNHTYCAVVTYTRGSSTNPATPSSLAAFGLTWTLRSMRAFGSGTSRLGIALYTAYGTPSAGALTITHGWTLGATERCSWSVTEHTGIDIEDPVKFPYKSNEVYGNSNASAQSLAEAAQQTVAGNCGPTLHCLAWVGSGDYTADAAWSALSEVVSATGLTHGHAVSQSSSITGGTHTWVGASVCLEQHFELNLAQTAQLIGIGAWVNNTVGGASVTPTLPSGYAATVAGDTAVIIVTGKAYHVSANPSTPAGYTLISNHNSTTSFSSFTERHLVYTKTLTDAEAMPSFTMVDASWGGFGNGNMQTCVLIFRGVSAADLTDGIVQSATTNSDPPPPEVPSPTAAGRIAVYVLCSTAAVNINSNGQRGWNMTGHSDLAYNVYTRYTVGTTGPALPNLSANGRGSLFFYVK